MAKTSSIPSAIAPTGVRHFELDWLRTLVVLGLIPYHAAVVFAEGPGDYVKAGGRSLFFDGVATVVAFWGMPLLFLVAGAATWYALSVRSPRRYLGERFGRLAIPFVVGVLTVVPVQLYFYDRSATPGYHQSYPQFYMGYLSGWAHITWHGAFALGLQYWGHLWFVLYLLAVSAFLLPIMLWLRGGVARRFLARLSNSSRQAASVFLPGALFAMVEVALQGPIGPRPFVDYSNLYSGAAGLVLYAVAFIVGFALFSEKGFLDALRAERRLALAQAIGLLILQEIALAAIGGRVAGVAAGATAIRAVRGYTTWCWLVALVGYALRYLTAGSQALSNLNEACFPVYVLHMPILTAVAFYIARGQGAMVARFGIVVAATALISFALYDVFVRRFAPMRILFGLKPSLAGERPPAAPREATTVSAH